MSGAAVGDMFALRQALIRGVEYLAKTQSPPAFVTAVVADLASRGVSAVGAAPETVSLGAPHAEARNGAIESPASLTAAAIAEILSAQQADGSWPTLPAPLAPERTEAAAGTCLTSTAACLQALAATIPILSPNRDLERAFWRDGYFVLEQFLAAEDVDALARAHREIHGTKDVGFYSSWFESAEARVFTDRQVRAVVAGRLKSLFPSHRMIFGTFMSKGCEGETEFPLHQDPTFVDERQWTSVTFWIPLVDVDERNGCIHAVPGSHLLSAEPRLPYVAFPYADFSERLEACLRPIRMRAGDLLVFHPGLIHASPPNVTGRLRIAAAGNIVPEPAQTFFYRSREGDEEITEVFAVDDAYYVGMAGDDAISESTRVGELRRPKPSGAIERLLANAEAASNGGHATRRPMASSPGASSPGVRTPPAGAVPPGSKAEETADDRSRVRVEPALRAALADAVARATGSAWELSDAAREGNAIALKVGEQTFDLRQAKPGVNSFKTVDGIAYSYRGRDLPAPALQRFQAIIAQLRPLTRTIDELLSSPLPEPTADDGASKGESAPARSDGPTTEGSGGVRRSRRAPAAADLGPHPTWRSVRDLPRLESLSAVEFDAASIDLERAARVYAEVGMLVVRGLLRPYMEPMLAEIREAVELAYRELPEAKMERHGLLTPSGGVFSRVGPRQLICAPLTLPTSPTMRQYASDPLFVSLLDELLAHEVHLIGSGQVMYKVADGGVETGLHQDASYTKDFGFKEVIAAFTYVVPTTIERGCIWLVPYSHRLGLLPHQEEGDHAGVVVPGTADWEHAIPIPGNPGDTLLWHFNVLHGSQPNVTAEDRPAVVIRYGRRGDADVLAEHGLQDW